MDVSTPGASFALVTALLGNVDDLRALPAAGVMLLLRLPLS